MSATLRGPSGLVYLDETVLTIGRSRQNRLVFTHSQISSKHAEIQPLGLGRYQVVDVGSSNGTSVNGRRLNKGTPYPLNDGDVLLLGGSGGIELTFAAPMVQAAAPLLQPQANVPVMEQPYAAVPPAPAVALPVPPPPGPVASLEYPYGRPEPLAAPAPAPRPAPMPMAISNVARYKRPPRALLVAGSLLLVVLVVVGVVLGTKVIGGAASPKQTGPAATATGTSPAGTAVLQTAKATVQGKETTILVTTKGLTLYYFTPDTATKTACTGDCIAKWPPLLFDGSGELKAASDLPGTLSIQTSDNGPQVAYNGHPLYTFSGDTAPGQTNGEGKNGKWFVATPDLAENGDAPPLVQTANVTIDGKSTTILTTAQGLTLYYFTPDTATQSACTGACAQTWPPLLFSGEGDPTASPDLPGTLSVQDTDNGSQVEYNGHLLYTFSGDTAPGQTSGQGKNGKWFVATPDLEVQG